MEAEEKFFALTLIIGGILSCLCLIETERCLKEIFISDERHQAGKTQYIRLVVRQKCFLLCPGTGLHIVKINTDEIAAARFFRASGAEIRLNSCLL